MGQPDRLSVELRTDTRYCTVGARRLYCAGGGEVVDGPSTHYQMVGRECQGSRGIQGIQGE